MLSTDLKFKLLYFDVETASCEPSLADLENKNPRLASLWSKRAIYYRTAYTELSESTDEEIFLQKSALEPEFCRVVCVSFGMMEDNTGVRKVSFYGEDEIDILNKTNKIFKNAILKNWKLCGHNIKGFDVPCLGKRMLYNGISPSSNIQMWDKKPWETPLVDTSEIFSFGNWVQQKYLGLDLLACSLGIKSPKEDIKGSEVSHVFWVDKDYEKIREYCERDVETVVEIISAISKN
jgi:predicted PolB exonuclease-like 3'-5' exonuclease